MIFQPMHGLSLLCKCVESVSSKSAKGNPSFYFEGSVLEPSPQNVSKQNPGGRGYVSLYRPDSIPICCDCLGCCRLPNTQHVRRAVRFILKT